MSALCHIFPGAAGKVKNGRRIKPIKDRRGTDCRPPKKREGNFYNMLGVYNYTVLLTYIGMLTGPHRHRLRHGRTDPMGAAVPCFLAGLCDMFDGKIASTKKDRTPQEKRFGVQIDSLSDLICFGVLPVSRFTLRLAARFMPPLQRDYMYCGADSPGLVQCR